jgi:hypothetical protein
VHSRWKIRCLGPTTWRVQRPWLDNGWKNQQASGFNIFKELEFYTIKGWGINSNIVKKGHAYTWDDGGWWFCCDCVFRGPPTCCFVGDVLCVPCIVLLSACQLKL